MNKKHVVIGLLILFIGLAVLLTRSTHIQEDKTFLGEANSSLLGRVVFNTSKEVGFPHCANLATAEFPGPLGVIDMAFPGDGIVYKYTIWYILQEDVATFFDGYIEGKIWGDQFVRSENPEHLEDFLIEVDMGNLETGYNMAISFEDLGKTESYTFNICERAASQ